MMVARYTDRAHELGRGKPSYQEHLFANGRSTFSTRTFCSTQCLTNSMEITLAYFPLLLWWRKAPENWSKICHLRENSVQRISSTRREVGENQSAWTRPRCYLLATGVTQRKSRLSFKVFIVITLYHRALQLFKMSSQFNSLSSLTLYYYFNSQNCSLQNLIPKTNLAKV